MRRIHKENKRKNQLHKKGFTLMEVLIASAILASTLGLILGVFTQCLNSTQGANNFTEATNACQLYLEKIRARINPDNETVTIGFANLGQWNAKYFQLENGNFVVTCYAQQIPSAPLSIWNVKVLTCWRDVRGRIIGEDLNLNGQLDQGEDANYNGELDSPVQLETVLVEGGT